jgi:hypothetical protein
MAGGDDARMLPNLFEAVVYSNTGIENTTLIAAHVTKMTMGTFSNIYDNGTALGFASGYGAGTTLAQSGDFEDMGVVALGAGTDTDGVTAGAMIYNGIDGVTLQAWDYYAHDILNAVYLQADFKWNCRISDTIKPFASLQYINEQDVGSFNGKVDSNYWGAKFGASIGNLTAYVAYSKTGDSNATYDGGIISPWGGMPAFTQGMVTRHQFFSGTEAWKVAATYKLTPELSATGYYTSFDVPANNAYGLAQTTPFSAAWTAKESGFDVIYQATNDLQVRFRGNFPDKFTPTVGWNEYRFIVNYNF